RGGRPSAEQRAITTGLVELARAGHRVLRLKGGDPCVFGRGGEEAVALMRAGVPFRIIPGVTAGLAGLTTAAIPATFRGMNRAVILAAGDGFDDGCLEWAGAARTGQPIVLYMAMRNLAKIAEELMRGGLPPSTPAAVIVSATTIEERVVVSSLARVAADAQDQQLGTPSVIVIGSIVKLREQLLDTVTEIASCPPALSSSQREIPAPARQPSPSACFRRSSERASLCGRRKPAPTTSTPRFTLRRRERKRSISTLGLCRPRSL